MTYYVQYSKNFTICRIPLGTNSFSYCMIISSEY